SRQEPSWPQPSWRGPSSRRSSSPPPSRSSSRPGGSPRRRSRRARSQQYWRRSQSSFFRRRPVRAVRHTRATGLLVAAHVRRGGARIPSNRYHGARTHGAVKPVEYNGRRARLFPDGRRDQEGVFVVVSGSSLTASPGLGAPSTTRRAEALRFSFPMGGLRRSPITIRLASTSSVTDSRKDRKSTRLNSSH